MHLGDPFVVREGGRVVVQPRVLGESDAQVDAAVACLRASHGRVSLEELARRSALSPRQLERRFRAAVGYGPKMLARIARFQRAWQLANAHPAATGAAIAARAGDYDQAHLVRDFRQFTGEPPRRFLASLAGQRELAGCFGG